MRGDVATRRALALLILALATLPDRAGAEEPPGAQAPGVTRPQEGPPPAGLFDFSAS